MGRQDGDDRPLPPGLTRLANGGYRAIVELPRGRDGKRRRVEKTGQKAGPLLEWMRTTRAEVKAGREVLVGGPTVEWWMDYWLKEIAAPTTRPKTLANYRSHARQHVVPILGKKKLKDLVPDDVRRMGTIITSQGLSGATAYQAHAALRAALTAALADGHVTRNVAMIAKAPRRGRSNRTAFTAEETAGLLAAIAQDRLALRWQLGLTVGARRGEIIGLELDHVRPDLVVVEWQLQRLTMVHGCARRPGDGPPWPCGRKRGGSCPLAVPEVLNPEVEYRPLVGALFLTRPKSEAGRRPFPIPVEMQDMVAARIEAANAEPNPHGLLFTRNPHVGPDGTPGPLDGYPISPEADTAAWQAIAERAGITRKSTPYELRHTFSTLLQASGADPSTRIKLMGHSDISTSQRVYEHLELEVLRDAIQGVIQRIGISPGTPPSGATPDDAAAATPTTAPDLLVAPDRAMGDPDLVAITPGWSGDIGAAQRALEAVDRLGAGTVVVLGNLGALLPGRKGRTYDQALVELLVDLDLELILVDGPNDPHPRLQGLATTPPGPIRVLDRVTWAPRGMRWRWSGRTVAALGGGHAIDGVEGLTRWAKLEAVTAADLDALSDDPVDLLLAVTSPVEESESGAFVRRALQTASPRLVAHAGSDTGTEERLSTPDGHLGVVDLVGWTHTTIPITLV